MKQGSPWTTPLIGAAFVVLMVAGVASGGETARTLSTTGSSATSRGS